MAQEIEYRPRIDTSDLAAQLQEVRNQINAAVSQQTFVNSVPSPQPQMFAFPLDNAMGMAANDARDFGAAAQAATANGMSAAQNTVNTARLGFQKFVNDAQNAALTASYHSPYSGTPSFPVFNPSNYISTYAAANFGYGFDPRSSITPGRYQERAREALAEGSENFRFGLIGTGLGAMLGMPWGPTGMSIGSTIGGFAGDFAYDAAESMFARDYSTGKNIRNYARETSWRFLSGQLNRGDLGVIGLEASRMARAPETAGYDISRGDIERVTKEYTEIGGFDYVRSAEDYRTKLKDVITGHRKVMQILRMTEQDALSAMKELSAFGIDPSSSATGLAALAYSAGYSSKEFMQFGGQMAEMVRGTGINLGSAYAGGMMALSAMKDGMKDGVVPISLVAQNGGVENMVRSNVRAGYEWANSMSGFTQLIADAAMGGPGRAAGLDAVSTISTAVGALTSGGLQSILEAQGTQPERISQYSGSTLQTYSAAQWVKQIQQFMPHVELNQATYRAILQQNGLSIVEADNKWNSLALAQENLRNASRNKARITAEQARQITESVPMAWDVAKDTFTGAVSDFFDVASNAFLTADERAYASNNANVIEQSRGNFRLGRDGSYEQINGYTDREREEIKTELRKQKGNEKKNFSKTELNIALASRDAVKYKKDADVQAGRIKSYADSMGMTFLAAVYGTSTDEELGSILSNTSAAGVASKVREYGRAQGWDTNKTEDTARSFGRIYTNFAGKYGEELQKAKDAIELAQDAELSRRSGVKQHSRQWHEDNYNTNTKQTNELMGQRVGAVVASAFGGSGIVGSVVSDVTTTVADLLTVGGRRGRNESVIAKDIEKKAGNDALIRKLNEQNEQDAAILKGLGSMDFRGSRLGAGSPPDEVMAQLNERIAAQQTASNTKGILDFLRNGGKMPTGNN